MEREYPSQSKQEARKLNESESETKIGLHSWVRFYRTGEGIRIEGEVVDWYSADAMHHQPVVRTKEHRDYVLNENYVVEKVWDSKSLREAEKAAREEVKKPLGIEEIRRKREEKRPPEEEEKEERKIA